MDGLSYYILSGCEREYAFVKFIRPDFLGSKSPSVIKNSVSQFFAMKEVKEYIDAYRKTIEGILSRSEASESKRPVNIEERKAKAKTKLVEFAMSLADHIDEADDPEAVLKIADKIGLLDQDEQAEEQPRRYLPVTCGECVYRKFVEENCDKEGDGTEIEAESAE